MNGVACEWCGTAVVYLDGEWWRAKGGVGATACEESEDGRHDPGVSREAHDEGAACPCVSDHRPPVLEFQRHHRLPLYLGGLDVPENVTWLCSTSHDSVHELLRLVLRGGRLSYAECQALERPRVVSRYAYALALQGYDEWKATQP